MTYGFVRNYHVHATVSLAAKDFDRLFCRCDDLLFLCGMHRSLASKIVEGSLLINPDLLPVDRKNSRGISGEILACIADNPVGNNADGEILTLNIPLGKLALSRFTFGEPHSHCPASFHRFYHPFSRPGAAGNGYAILGKDLLRLDFICTELPQS